MSILPQESLFWVKELYTKRRRQLSSSTASASDLPVGRPSWPSTERVVSFCQPSSSSSAAASSNQIIMSSSSSTTSSSSSGSIEPDTVSASPTPPTDLKSGLAQKLEELDRLNRSLKERLVVMRPPANSTSTTETRNSHSHNNSNTVRSSPVRRHEPTAVSPIIDELFPSRRIFTGDSSSLSSSSSATAGAGGGVTSIINLRVTHVERTSTSRPAATFQTQSQQPPVPALAQPPTSTSVLDSFWTSSIHSDGAAGGGGLNIEIVETVHEADQVLTHREEEEKDEYESNEQGNRRDDSEPQSKSNVRLQPPEPIKTVENVNNNNNDTELDQTFNLNTSFEEDSKGNNNNNKNSDFRRQQQQQPFSMFVQQFADDNTISTTGDENACNNDPIVDCTKFDTNDDDEVNNEEYYDEYRQPVNTPNDLGGRQIGIRPTITTKEVSLFIPSNVKVVRTYETDEVNDNNENLTEVVPEELNRIDEDNERRICEENEVSGFIELNKLF